MKTFLTVIATLLLGAASTMPLRAQLDVAVEGVSDASVLGDTIVFDSDGIGQRVSQRLYLNFDPGAGQNLTLRTVLIKGPQASEFTHEIKDVTRLPIVIRNELQLDLFVFYLPTSGGPAQAVIELTLRLEGSDLDPTDTIYTVNLVGRVPSYSLSYMLPGGPSRQVPVAGNVDFGNKGTGQATEASLILTNNGSGSGILRDVQISGSAVYSLVNPPSFPARIEPGRTLNIQLAFTPATTDAYRGLLTFDFGTLQQQFNLAGVGGDLLRYRLVLYSGGGVPGPAAEIQSGNTIAFGQQAASVEITGRNIRQSAQLVRSISVTGPFSVIEAPTLPVSLQPGESLVVRVEPRSVSVGDHSGALLIDDAYFPLSLSVPDLPGVRFSRTGGAVSGAETVPLAISLAQPYPVDLSGTLDLEFASADFVSDPSVQWSTGGNRASFTIPAGQTQAVFSLGGTQIEFQASSVSGEIVVSARFSADTWGIDITPDAAPELRFNVEIPELPAVRFSRSGGAVSATEEVPLGLSLDQPYPVDLTGTLYLEFVPEDFEGDPTVQWSTGGRQVPFTVPAGSTVAVFGQDSPTVYFRAGAVLGEIVVTASILAESWNADLTPETVPEVRFDVAIPELPEVRFSRAGATIRGAEQIPLGVSIAEPFPVELTGTLSLEFVASDFEGDPSVQWASGGRQVAFTISAGTTSATFSAGAEEVEFRAAKVPGEIVVTAQVQAEEWNRDLTPDEAPEIRFNVEIPALPEVTFSTGHMTVGAAEQIPLGVSIERAYSTDIVGALFLAFETRVFTSDPAVQWATGGRIVPFTILKGATVALFLNDELTNSFQTGTVAGEIVVTARFVSVTEGLPRTVEEAQAQASAIEITPDTLPEVRFTVMEAAPVLQRVALGSTGQGRFTLAITGFATSRSVDSLSFGFTGVSGSDLRTPTLEADVTQNFRTYYGGNQSASFGSQFTATVEFMLDEGVYEDLSNVSVTAANGSGTSNSVSLSLN